MALSTLAVGAKRYDSGSGAAVFSGVIPLKPGQLVEADLNRVALWDGAQEIGCTASALWPQHPDGSMKVVQIAATLNLASGVQKNLTLRLGDPRTVSGPAQPFINEAWMKNPRLIGCTDAAHLCASRVATLPLVPIPSPLLPESWNKFLTEEWDDPDTTYASWGRVKARVMADDPNTFGLWGAANYNFLNAMYCKYLTSGDLDRLNEAHHVAQYGSHAGGSGFPRSVEECSYGSIEMGRRNADGTVEHPGLNNVVFYGEAHEGHAAGSLFDANPDGWSDRGGQPITGTEWNSGVDTDFLMCYTLSGWEQIRGTFLCRALAHFGHTGGFPDGPIADISEEGLATKNQPILGHGGRFQWRLIRGVDILYTLLSAPMALRFAYRWWTGKVIPSPRTAEARAQFKTWAKREHLDFYDWYSSRYVDGHWLKDSWWSKPGWFEQNTSVPQGLPFFQLAVLWYDVMMYYYHIDQDPRVPAFIERSAEMLRQCVHGPEGAPKMDGVAYRLRYPVTNSYTNNATDGPETSGPTDGFWGNTILLPLWATAYRLTGDTFYRNLIDLHASNTRLAIADGGRAGGSTFKEMGECYSFAFHAAAMRAGVPVGAWEVNGTPPPPQDPDPEPEPEPEPGEIMATLNTTITLESQQHETDYTGMRIRFQRSTDGGFTWDDVQSNVRALGTTQDSYGVPVGQSGHYRAGAALTDGAAVGTEVFSNVVQVAVFEVLTPTTITLTIA